MSNPTKLKGAKGIRRSPKMCQDKLLQFMKLWPSAGGQKIMVGEIQKSWVNHCATIITTTYPMPFTWLLGIPIKKYVE